MCVCISDKIIIEQKTVNCLTKSYSPKPKRTKLFIAIFQTPYLFFKK